MRHLETHQLAAPPLPDGQLAEAWRGYLACWVQGRRHDALSSANQFVDLLTATTSETITTFAAWVCSTLFDDTDRWAGQWGGGMTLRDGRWERPAEPALTVHPIATRVLLPYLVNGLLDQHGRHLRWVYQFTVGQGYRLPPREQEHLTAAIEARCGPGAPPIALLHRADDAEARRMLRDAEAN